ncbi:hypothetical protein GCM10011348_41430 [Marinobacterium nitratireducens]|uniref:SPOR domain-containing protein n=1 Tax=Marinobacterium nitratireducens TaxID=518897 RepID=A0A917ZQE2_9GAMM|nr:hypothetical protein [Marinobacterium nitratireducens]GGO87684.1 hypothetical protein GCM10011348_41430 [Marinobacterium nitratireducens]
MLRWLFLLLLLANAVVLLWAAMMRPDQSREPLPPPADAGRELRLLSEVSSGALTLRPVQPQAAPSNLCLVYEGFADRLAADQAAVLMRSNGLDPQVEVETEMLPDGFELVLDLPASSAERLALIERLDGLGIVPEGRPDDGVLKLGRFTGEGGAGDELERFGEAGLAPQLRPLERPRERFRLLIPAATDRELFNKINRVLENTQPEIKIEKKVCEGVASPRGDQ